MHDENDGDDDDGDDGDGGVTWRGAVRAVGCFHELR